MDADWRCEQPEPFATVSRALVSSTAAVTSAPGTALGVGTQWKRVNAGSYPR